MSRDIDWSKIGKEEDPDWSPFYYYKPQETKWIVCINHEPVDTGIPGGSIWCKKCDSSIRWDGERWI